MSRLFTSLSRSPQGSAADWYLKTNDGETHGPLTASELSDWSDSGRILPGSTISHDRINWTPVEKLPTGKMDWHAMTKSGQSNNPSEAMRLLTKQLEEQGATLAKAREDFALREQELGKCIEEACKEAGQAKESLEGALQESRVLKSIAEEAEEKHRRRETELADEIGALKATVLAAEQSMAAQETGKAGKKDQDSRSPTKEWFLRIGAGGIFGPVPWNDLFDWAAQCRIAPTDQLSQDKDSWTLAADVPELAMNWSAAMPGGGVLGPFNLLALLQLVGEGNVPADAKFTNRITGSALTLAEACLAELVANNTALYGLKADIESIRLELAAAMASSRSLASPTMPIPPQSVRRHMAAQRDLAR